MALNSLSGSILHTFNLFKKIFRFYHCIFQVKNTQHSLKQFAANNYRVDGLKEFPANNMYAVFTYI